MLNSVELIGFLGNDPEIKETSSGNKFATLSLATYEVIKGEKKTQWHRVVWWDSMKAAVLENYTSKGSKIYIRGQVEYAEYTNKDGNTVKTTDIVLGQFNSTLILLDKKGDNQPVAQKPVVNNDADFDDDLPY